MNGGRASCRGDDDDLISSPGYLFLVPCSIALRTSVLLTKFGTLLARTMRFKESFLHIALFSSTTAGKPLASPPGQDETQLDFSEISPSDTDLLFTEAPSNDIIDSSLSPSNTFPDDATDYSMFSDNNNDDVNPAAFLAGSTGDIVGNNNLIASCLGESNNVNSLLGDDSANILRSREDYSPDDNTNWITMEGTQCSVNNRNPQQPPPPPEPQLRTPSLLEEYFDTPECPPLPDGRRRQPLCCYSPDVEVSPGTYVAEFCWRRQLFSITYVILNFV